MINLDHFRNKQIMHKMIELTVFEPTATLPEGSIFYGPIEYSGEGFVYINCVYDLLGPFRNFKFMIIDNDVPFNLPYDYVLIGSRIYPLPEGGGKSISVYVEREL